VTKRISAVLICQFDDLITWIADAEQQEATHSGPSHLTYHAPASQWLPSFGFGQPPASLGHFLSSKQPDNRHANERFQCTADIARRQFERAHSRKQSPKVSRRWPASEAGRMSAVQAAELQLPTLTRRSSF